MRKHLTMAAHSSESTEIRQPELKEHGTRESEREPAQLEANQETEAKGVRKAAIHTGLLAINKCLGAAPLSAAGGAARAAAGGSRRGGGEVARPRG